MKKIIVSSSILLALTLTLAGCSAADNETKPVANSDGSSSSSTPPVESVDWTFEEAVKTAVGNESPVVAGNWEITVGDLTVDENNVITELYDVAAPEEGLSYAGVRLSFQYLGDGDPLEEISTVKVVLADQDGKKFDTQAPDELYDALGTGMNLDLLESQGIAAGATFVQVDPNTKQFYLAIGVTDDAPPVLVKLNVLDF